MCGIVARVSHELNPSKTLELLKTLEYRGYDSFGILLSNEKEEKLIKETGSLNFELFEELKKEKSSIELGHTRWATHGGVSQENAHPHFDAEKKIFVVMNGIIENYLELIEKYKLELISQSDTEVIPHLFKRYTEKSTELEALKKLLTELEGEFSFVLKTKTKLYAYKRTNPLILGKNKDELILCSDLNSLQNYCDEFYVMDDEELLIIEKEEEKIKYKLLNVNFEEKKPSFEKTKFQEKNKEKEKEYYMEEEIHEQKEVLSVLSPENLYAIKKIKEKLREKKLVLVGAGTSYHAALYLHYLLLKRGINSQVILASELENYINTLENSLILALSQSGETADLIHPLKLLKEKNSIYAMTNTSYSTLDRMASQSLYLNCGKEYAVASTKAFLAQIALSKLIAGEEELVKKELEFFVSYFDLLIEKNERALQKIVEEFAHTKNFFFIGRANYYPLALEGALKLKEISYLNSEGFAGGELKHGTLSLVENKTPIFVLGNQKTIFSNAIETKSRGASIILASSEENSLSDYPLWIPKECEELATIVLLQYLAFKMAVKLKRNPDKPRNLAKSVTVK